MGVMHSVCIFVFIVCRLSLYLWLLHWECTMLLVRSDVSAGNSLSVLHLTAVRCYYADIFESAVSEIN